MTAQPDGTHVCDRCGKDCGNGGVFDAIVVSDLSIDSGMVVNLHFCRGRWDDAGTYTIGCDQAILGAANMENFLATQPNYKRPEKGTPPPPADEGQSDAG